MKLFELFATLSLDSSGFERGLTQAEKSLQNVTGKIKSGVQTMLKVGAAAAAATVAAGTYIAKTGLGYNRTIEDYTANMQTLLGGTDKAEAKIKELSKMAATTPFELSNLADATQTLLAFGVESDKSTGILKSLGDISLGNADKLQTLTRAYGKMSSTGKVTLENVQMMIDAGFNPLNLIAERNNVTMESLYKALSEGKVPFSELEWAIKKATSAGGQFYGGMETASKTLSGRLATLSDNWSAFLGAVTKPAYEVLKDTVLPDAIDMVEDLTAALDEDGLKGVWDTVAARISSAGSNIATKITEYFDSDQAAQDLQATTGKIARLMTSGNIVLADVLGFGNRIIQMISNTLKQPETISKMGDVTAQLVTGLVTCRSNEITAIVNGLGIAADIATSILDGVAKAAPDGAEKIVNAIGDGIAAVVEHAPAKATKLALGAAKVGAGLIAGIVKAIPDGAASIINAISDMFGDENTGEIKSAIDDFADYITHLFDSPDTTALYGALDGIRQKAAEIQQDISGAEKSYIKTRQELKTRADMAEGYLQTIETLQSKETVSDSELNAWQEATNKLVALYPELANQVNAETGVFTGNTAAIRDNIKAMQDQAVEAAKAKLMSSYTASMADLVSQQVDAQIKINEIKDGITALADEYGAVKDQYGNYSMPPGYQSASADSEQYSSLLNRIAGVSVADEKVAEFNKKYSELQQLMAEAVSGKEQIDAAVDNLAQEQSTKIDTLNAMYAATSEQAKTAKTDVDDVKAAIDSIPENKESTITIKTVQQGVLPVAPQGYTYRPHATGLYDVPYDGYAAILHAGERVLTRAQADESRKPKSAQKATQDVYNINIQSTAESPSETAAYIKQAMRTLRFNQS